MKTEQLITVGLFTIATVLTIYFWMDRGFLVGQTQKEGFQTNTDVISKIQAAVAAPPSDAEMNEAYMTVLRYIRDTPEKGLKFVFDVGDRFFENSQLKPDLDLTRILDNYVPPLQKKQ